MDYEKDNIERDIRWLINGIYQFVRKLNIEEIDFNIRNFMGKFSILAEEKDISSETYIYRELIICKLYRCSSIPKQNALMYSCKKVFEELGCINSEGNVFLRIAELDILEEIFENYDKDLYFEYINRYKREKWLEK